MATKIPVFQNETTNGAKSWQVINRTSLGGNGGALLIVEGTFDGATVIFDASIDGGTTPFAVTDNAGTVVSYTVARGAFVETALGESIRGTISGAGAGTDLSAYLVPVG